MAAVTVAVRKDEPISKHTPSYNLPWSMVRREILRQLLKPALRGPPTAGNKFMAINRMGRLRRRLSHTRNAIRGSEKIRGRFRTVGTAPVTSNHTPFDAHALGVTVAYPAPTRLARVRILQGML